MRIDQRIILFAGHCSSTYISCELCMYVCIFVYYILVCATEATEWD